MKFELCRRTGVKSNVFPFPLLKWNIPQNHACYFIIFFSSILFISHYFTIFNSDSPKKAKYKKRQIHYSFGKGVIVFLSAYGLSWPSCVISMGVFLFFCCHFFFVFLNRKTFQFMTIN